MKFRNYTADQTKLILDSFNEEEKINIFNKIFRKYPSLNNEQKIKGISKIEALNAKEKKSDEQVFVLNDYWNHLTKDFEEKKLSNPKAMEDIIIRELKNSLSQKPLLAQQLNRAKESSSHSRHFFSRGILKNWVPGAGIKNAITRNPLPKVKQTNLFEHLYELSELTNTKKRANIIEAIKKQYQPTWYSSSDSSRALFLLLNSSKSDDEKWKAICVYLSDREGDYLKNNGKKLFIKLKELIENELSALPEVKDQKDSQETILSSPPPKVELPLITYKILKKSLEKKQKTEDLKEETQVTASDTTASPLEKEEEDLKSITQVVASGAANPFHAMHAKSILDVAYQVAKHSDSKEEFKVLFMVDHKDYIYNYKAKGNSAYQQRPHICDEKRIAIAKDFLQAALNQRISNAKTEDEKHIYQRMVIEVAHTRDPDYVGKELSTANSDYFNDWPEVFAEIKRKNKKAVYISNQEYEKHLVCYENCFPILMTTIPRDKDGPGAISSTAWVKGFTVEQMKQLDSVIPLQEQYAIYAKHVTKSKDLHNPDKFPIYQGALSKFAKAKTSYERGPQPEKLRQRFFWRTDAPLEILASQPILKSLSSTPTP